MNSEATVREQLEGIQNSVAFFIPELILSGGILLLVITGLILYKLKIKSLPEILYSASAVLLILSIVYTLRQWSLYQSPVSLFSGMLRTDDFSLYLKILFDISGIITLMMSFQRNIIARHHTEYSCLILAVILGAHLLVMSTNLVIVFISLELISISSYVLVGFALKKESSEGSLKYFLFGSVSSAVMLYGFSILYGITGTLEWSHTALAGKLTEQTPLLFIACMFSLAGFLFKLAAVPMHPWAPDVYEAAPMPVIAFFSVVPKLAGLGILTRFLFALGPDNSLLFDWQIIISLVALITIITGNFSALRQKIPKRMMAYSSIAQSGFLMLGVVTYSTEGIQFMLFYASIYLIANFLVFFYLQKFERMSIFTIQDFAGTGRIAQWPHLFLLTGFVALTGLPPTAGFTSKLFIFSGIWTSYENTGETFLLWVLIIGLLNTVVALFYYLRIPYFAFLKTRPGENTLNLTQQNLFGLVLVLLLLLLFFQPNLLMGWINKINFVLS